VEKGRAVFRAAFQDAAQQRIDASEKKGRRCGNAAVGRSARTEAPATGS
jgi:hypothetical protein